MTLQSLPISQVYPGNNPRQDFDEKAIEELAASIKQHGMIQPIMVRPLNDHIYEIVCGERRRRAAELAGLLEIPANVRQLTDDEAFEIAITENLQRKDVHPLDEAAAYKTYQDMKKVDIPELAAKFGKNPAYIAQRLSFNSLIPELKKDFHAGILLIGHAVLLARLQAADQKALIPQCKNHPHKGEPFYDSVDDMKHTIEDDIMRELTHAGFDKKDTQLVKKAGACTACQKRSGAGLLFQDVKEKDRCFDGTCFAAKVKAHLLKQIDNLVASPNPMPVVIGYSARDMDPDVKKKLADNKVKLLEEPEDYSESPKKATNATLALKVCGGDAGRIIGITLKSTPKAAAAKAAAPGASDEETIDSIDQLIAGIKERGKRADELDAEKVHQKIVAQLTDLKPYREADADWPFLEQSEDIAVLFLLFRQMQSDDKITLSKLLKVPAKKNSWGYVTIDEDGVAKALDGALPEHTAFLKRSAIKHELVANKLPPSVEAALVRRIAESYEGVPIATYEDEQKAIADKRKGNAKKRIAELEKKKKALKEPKPKKESTAEVSVRITNERIQRDAAEGKPSAVPKKRGHTQAKPSKTLKDLINQDPDDIDFDDDDE